MSIQKQKRVNFFFTLSVDCTPKTELFRKNNSVNILPLEESKWKRVEIKENIEQMFSSKH